MYSLSLHLPQFQQVSRDTPLCGIDLCMLRNETVQPVPNSYIHVSVINLYIPRIGLPIWLQKNRQTDHGNI
jgi:hypothetical protein